MIRTAAPSEPEMMPEAPDVERDLGDHISDDELAALALAADPDPHVGEDAACLWDLEAVGGVPLLPGWYMPTPMRRTRPLRGWRRRIVYLIIFSFLAIAAAGLCSTYGEVVLA